MSKIAEALAKAKQRTGVTTAPFFDAAAANEAKAEALRKAQNKQRFWILLLSVAIGLTSFVIWNRLKAPDENGRAVIAPVATAPDPAPPGQPAGVASERRPAAPRADLTQAVNEFVLTAVTPGERPRLIYKGRVVSVGDVVEGELVFAGLQDGRVLFSDRRGAIYSRRY